jgi:hypothetical protein
MKNREAIFSRGFFLICVLLGSCSWFGTDDSNSSSSGSGTSISVTVSPSSATLTKGTTQQFSAEVSGVSSYYKNRVNWSIDGQHEAGTTLSSTGLLFVAANETSRTFMVKALADYDGKTSGTATVTVATEAEVPSRLRASQAGKTGISLAWNTVNNAAGYKIYRSTNGKDYAHLADAASNSFNDTAIAAGSSYYYQVSARVNNLETGRSNAALVFAEEYFALPVFNDRRLVPLYASKKHYYRFPVTSGESYTIIWENGNSQNVHSDVRVAAWQNDGTNIFSNAYSGYTSPRVFTASITGYVTVEVTNISGGTLNYMIYCYRTNGESDTGVVAMPSAKPEGIKVTAPGPTSISLSWNPVTDAVRYNIYRAPNQNASAGLLGSSATAAFTDTGISAGVSYFYTIAAENADGREGVQVQGTFSFATLHYALPTQGESYQESLDTLDKRYYRLQVSAEQNITITWQNGSNQNSHSDVRVAAWQNDGTNIFSNAYSGYTSPRAFKVTLSGFVTIEVTNISGGSLDYQIYYH